MRIVHISDTHGPEYHLKLQIPECELLFHTGDLGDKKTTLAEFTEFLIWFEQQPAKVKIFCAGNHDALLDRELWKKERQDNLMPYWMLTKQQHEDALNLIQHYKVKYLNNTEYIYEGLKIFGFPYTPSFHRDNGWGFNADRGEEMKKWLGRIPGDVNILLTHGPCYGIQDEIPEKFKAYEEEDVHRGCQDMIALIRRRIRQLKLYCCGHIHDQVGVVIKPISNTRHVMFSNGAVVTNEGKQLVIKPLVINL